MAISKIGTDGIDQTSSQQIGGISVGKGSGNVATNTAVGASALATNSTGAGCTVVGYTAANVSTGDDITAVGTAAALLTTTGNNLVAVGTSALRSNTSGAFNTALGRDALRLNTTASNATAVGYQAGYTSTTGANLTAVGYQAGYSTTTGSNLAAFGYTAGYSNTTGNENTCLGMRAGYSNSTSSNNTFVGAEAGYNTTGAANTFVGRNSSGYGAGYYVTTGARNVILGGYNGNQGGIDIRTGGGNVILSDGDGANLFGYSSSFGHFWNSTSTYTQINWLNTGAQKAAMWWDNSLLRLVTYTGTTVGPYISNNGTSWTNSSDERLKNITGEIENGLSKVCSLRAAEYTWKADDEAKPQVGLIAQDVLAVLPEAVEVPEEGATERDGSPAMMGVQYNAVIPLLVAAIKELKAEFDAYKEAHP